MSEEEMMSLLRAIKEQLERMETRQQAMEARQQRIKSEIEEQPSVGSFGARDQ